MTDYYTPDELSSMGAVLLRDVVLWTLRLHREYTTNGYSAPATQAEPDPLPEAGAPPARKHGRQERTYASVYVGVTTHCGRFVAQWGVAPRCKSAWQPQTPEGARAAAVERAQALGRDYIERRDGNHEPL